MAEPTSPRDREPTLDVLRGFAMLGVLLANLYSLYSLRFVTMGGVPGDGALDTAAAWFMRLGVQGKAQTLLTCLFGFGFAAQLLRARERGEPVVAMYLRRLIALFVLGWLHVLLLAWVDVTWGYALVGFFLLAFLGVSNRTRVIVALVCMIVPSIIYAFPSVRPAVHGLLFDRPPPAIMFEFVGKARGDDWLAMPQINATMGALWMLGGNVLWYVPWLLGRFLIGYVVGAKRWFEGPRVDVFRKVLVVGVAVAVPGLVLELLMLLKVVELRGAGILVRALFAVAHEITVLAQTAAYIAIVVLVMQRTIWRRILGVLAPVGRMPLTTYLMQSAICPLLFYGWGLGWQTPAPARSVGLALAIFVGQVAFAHVWLRYFRFGPAEWLWRRVVYLRAQPMRV